MNSGAMQYLLLMGACLSLLGLALSGVMVSRSQSENEQRSRRLAAILAPHLRTAQIELSAFTVSEESKKLSSSNMLATIFGFSLERQALYPTRWYIVLAVTFLLALVGRYAADEMLGIFS